MFVQGNFIGAPSSGSISSCRKDKTEPLNLPMDTELSNRNPPRQPAHATVSSVRLEERCVLTVTCLAAFLFFNSFGGISVALPAIQRQFGNSLAEVQWITLMGVVTISSLSFCFGRAGDIFGQRRLYKIGVALYSLGAGLAALATSFVQLLLSRGVMAVGLAMALPMSAAILAGTFGAERRGRALGLFASAIAIGRATGPSIGGFLMYLWSWRSIFMMNCIVGAAVTVAVFAIFKGPGNCRRGPFDVWGSLTLLIGYPSLLVGLTAMANSGWNGGQNAWWFVLATIAMSGFLWIEHQSPSPLIDLQLFRHRSLSLTLSSTALSNALLNPITICGPLFLENVLNASPLMVGMVLSALPLMTALASPISGRLVDRGDAGLVMTIGAGIIVLGVLAYARLGMHASYATVGIALGIVGLGTGVFVPANQKLAFAAVQTQDYGILSAMLSSFSTAAGSLGTATVVALMEVGRLGVKFNDPAAFVVAQQSAFTTLLPLGLIACLIAARGWWRNGRAS